MFNTKTGVAGLSILSNTLLIILKTVVGVSTGSVSILSEAAHSSVDLLAALVAWFAVRTSARPANFRHPYGYGKVESISGAVEALLIFAAAGWIIYEAVRKLTGHIALESLNMGLVVMFLSVFVNLFVSRQLMRVATRTSSLALEADARHLTTDIATSAGVFIGLLAVQITGLTILDPVVAILVALIILRTAYRLTVKSVRDLMDVALPSHERITVAAIINQRNKELIEFHNLRSRRVGGQRHIDLHLVVDGKLSVEEAHELCSLIEQDIRDALPDSDVVIHLEPPSEAIRNKRQENSKPEI